MRPVRLGGRGGPRSVPAANTGREQPPRRPGAPGRSGPGNRTAGRLLAAARPAQFASAITWSQSVAQVRLISRETCIWEIPSCSAIRLWVMSQKNRM